MGEASALTVGRAKTVRLRDLRSPQPRFPPRISPAPFPPARQSSPADRFRWEGGAGQAVGGGRPTGCKWQPVVR